jgi:hypothetical protein
MMPIRPFKLNTASARGSTFSIVGVIAPASGASFQIGDDQDIINWIMHRFLKWFYKPAPADRHGLSG